MGKNSKKLVVSHVDIEGGKKKKPGKPAKEPVKKSIVKAAKESKEKKTPVIVCPTLLEPSPMFRYINII